MTALVKHRSLVILAAVAFAFAHSQAPLYYSNQHQYFLHGMATAGLGYLHEDWLSNTADPTPLFSALVAVTHHVSDWLFHGYFFAALMVYALTMVGVFRFVQGQDAPTAAGWLFALLIIAFHAGLPRLASAHWFGKDYPWFFQSGVAGQYILGPGLQPSVSGVLFLVAIALFLAKRPWLATGMSALAAVFHATYLPTAAFFTLAFMVITWRRGEGRQGLLMGTLALVMVVPVIVYDLAQFAPRDGSIFAEAQRIIARDRIPHHAQPSRWFDGLAAAQLVWIGLALWLVRRTTLFALLAIPFAFSAALSLLQVATGSDTLALLFPWRTSAVLVPLATAVNLARLSSAIGSRLTFATTGATLVCVGSLAGILAFVASGMWISLDNVAYRMTPEELPLLDYVRDHKQPGETYLLPVEIPKHKAAGRGNVSTSFTRPPQRGKQQGLISVDLQRFRLYTGAPIFVDFKSIPYRDDEVLEWWERMKRCQWLYEQPDWNAPEVRNVLAKHRITHVVTPATRPLKAAWAHEVFADTQYRLYRYLP